MEALKNNHEHTHTARITHKWADTKEVFPQATTKKKPSNAAEFEWEADVSTINVLVSVFFSLMA